MKSKNTIQNLRNKYTPMDMEWAKDGKTNKLYIVQARPETIHSRKNKNVIESYKLTKTTKLICKGLSIGEKVSFGKVKLISNIQKCYKILKMVIF